MINFNMLMSIFALPFTFKTSPANDGSDFRYEFGISLLKTDEIAQI